MKVKKFLVTMLTLLMIFGSTLPAYALSADDFPDMPTDWSEEAVRHAVENGLLVGSDGYILPNDSLTRAQMAAIVNRAFGAENTASLSNYTDVSSAAWYYEDMAKAVYMGTFVGDGEELNPENNITRQEAFIVLSRAFMLESSGTDALNRFEDSGDVAGWAEDEVAAMVEASYVQGSGGKLNPASEITRAEFAQLMYNMAKSYITNQGTVTEAAPGNVIARTGGVVLSGVTVSGDLIIADGVGSGSVSLDNVTVTDRVIIRGGGTISLGAGSDIDSVTVSSKVGVTNITVRSGASVGSIICNTSAYVSGEGSVYSVIANEGTVGVTTPDTTVTAGENATVIVGGVTVTPGETVLTNSEGDGIVTDTDSEVYRVSTYAQLMEALADAREGGTVKFTADITSTDGTVELGAVTDAVTGATLTVDKSITIDGGGYTLDADGYPTFEVTDEESNGTNAVMRNLTIENGAYNAKLGGAMIVEADAVLTMINVTMRNCYAGSTSTWNGGGAVFVNNHHGGAPTLRAISCTFENCYTGTDGTTGSGGAIYGSTGKVYLTDCTFTGNKAASGGAVAMLGTGTLRVTNCSFTENNASVTGNDIYIFDGQSAARMGTAASVIRVANISGTFDAEPADENGEVALADMNVVLGRYYGGDFTGTPAEALSFDGVTVHDVMFSNVERTKLATGVSTYAELMSALENSEEGDCILLTGDIKTTDGTVELGAATDAVTGATLTVDKSITVDGGGYTLDADGYPTFEVTDEAGNGTDAVMRNLTIENGAYSAKLGGAMIVEADAVLTMTNVTMRNCYAGSTSTWNGGGAVFVNNHHGGAPTLYAVNCAFENCYTGTDGTTGSGGAVYGSTGNVYLTDCTFTGNKAASGGAVAMLGAGTLSVTNCTFGGNNASVTGNDIYIFDGQSAARMGTATSVITVTNISGTFDAEPADENGEVALADMNVVLGRYYGDDFTGTPARKLSFDGVTVHDVTFASIDRLG